MSSEDETSLFLRVIGTADVDIDSLQRSFVIAKRLPTMKDLGQAVLSAQTTSVSSNGLCYRAGILISSYLADLNDAILSFPPPGDI